MVEKMNSFGGPHQGQPVRTAGEPVERARAVMLMLHGRGAQAEDILTLTPQLDQAGFAYFAPQAAGNAWYPNPFLAPLADNEPWLSSALAFVNQVFKQIVRSGIPPQRIMLLGFSQGACLALEYSARHPIRYGGVVSLSGALIGPDDAHRDMAGSLAGTPVFLGCSDVDPYVSKERVAHAAEVMTGIGGEVDLRLYPNMDHSVNLDEIAAVRSIMQALAGSS
jgi:predicted esterase